MNQSAVLKATMVVMAVASVSLAGACEEATGPGSSRREVGILQLATAAMPEATAQRDSAVTWNKPPGGGTVTAPVPIAAPDTVWAGQAFTVVVTTVGPNGCWRADGQDDTLAGRVIEIIPFDIHSGADVCTQALGFLPHQKSFTLTERGQWTLRARGRLAYPQDPGADSPVVAERILIVR